MPAAPLNPNPPARFELDALIATLVRARKHHGHLTQRRLAESLGLAVNSVQDWELRRDTPTLPHLIRWARKLGFRLDVEDDGSPEPPQPPPPAPAGRPGPNRVPDYARLVATLRAKRRHLRIRQEDLADQLGVHRGQVIRWEHARTHPPPMTFIAWAHALGCRVRLARPPSQGPIPQASARTLTRP
jgi:transcriptional regulator with XRE-family HTH domain